MIVVVLAVVLAGGCTGSPASRRAASSSSTTNAPIDSGAGTASTTTTTAPPPPPATVVTLAYVRTGLGVVGTATVRPGEEPQSRRLYLSTDLTHWRDATPKPRAPKPTDDLPDFEQASFLDARTGWVTGWDPRPRTTVYRTRDGGRSWTSVSTEGHSLHGGSSTLIQLVTPSLAFLEDTDPAAPGTVLEVSTDAGRSWRSVYDASVEPGPDLMAMVFVDARHGFAGSDISAGASLPAWSVDFFVTDDGGRKWTKAHPPLPRGGADCPMRIGDEGPTSCRFARPTFFGSRSGVLPGVVESHSQATIGFDTTSDGGRSFALRAQRSVAIEPGPPEGHSFVDPLVSIASPSAWWIVTTSTDGLSTATTTDGGRTWSEARSPSVAGPPRNVMALDATRALLTAGHPGSSQLFETHDAGRTWRPVALPAR